MPDLHLDPDRLRGHAATAGALAGDLGAVLGAVPDDPDARRLHDAVARAARELADLGAAVVGAAAAVEGVDRAAARRFGALG